MKKRTIGILAGLAALGGVIYLGNQLRAQQQLNPQLQGGVQPQVAPAVTRVAVLNLGQVIRNYVKFKSFETDMNNRKAGFRKQLDDMNNLLVAKQAEIAKPDTLQQRREQLDKEARDLQRRMQDFGEDAKQQLAKVEFDQLVQTYKEVQDAVSAYAKVRNIEMVFHHSDAIGTDAWLPQFFTRKLANNACIPIYTHPSLDITNDITNMLNARVASTMPPAAPTAPGAAAVPPGRGQ